MSERRRRGEDDERSGPDSEGRKSRREAEEETVEETDKR